MSRVRDIANILSGGSSAIATDTEIPSYIAGKNILINGAFDFWQRGTSFSLSGASSISNYTADRWSAGVNSGVVVSRVAGINSGSNYGLRMQRTAGNTNIGDNFVVQTIESSMVSLLAGQIVTLSFYLRKGADFSGAAVYCVPRFGTGTDEGVGNGYSGLWTGHNQLIHTVNPTTSSVRYTKTFTVPAGTKEMMLLMGPQSMTGTAGTNDWIEFEQIQLEIGSVATSFSRAGGTIQGELAACQRYYWKAITAITLNGIPTVGFAIGQSTTTANAWVRFPVTMRGNGPSSIDVANPRLYSSAQFNPTAVTLANATPDESQLSITVSGGGLVQNQVYNFGHDNGAGSYVAFSAEL